MSDTEESKETAVLQEAEIPPQQSATDTTNWDNKVSTDTSGEKYIQYY